MKREPFTSTALQAGACASAANQAPTSSKWRAPRTIGRVRAELADRPQRLDAALLRIGTDLGMERDTLVADLAHVAEHEPARSRQPDQHIDRGAHRVRIRVVGVVDQGHAAAGPLEYLRLRAPADRREGGEAAGDRIERAAGGQRAGGRGERVLDVVQTSRGKPGRERAGRRAYLELPVIGLPFGAAGHVGTAPECERERAARPGELAPAAGMRVVGREHRDAAAPSASIAAPFGVRHASTLAMNSWWCALALLTSATVGADKRASPRSRRGVHAHRPLPRCCIVRHGSGATASAAPDGLFKFRASPARRPQPGTQDRGRSSAHGGLAVAAGDCISGSSKRRRHAPARSVSPAACRNLEPARPLRRGRARHAATPPAFAWPRSRGIEALAFQRDEQVAG